MALNRSQRILHSVLTPQRQNGHQVVEFQIESLDSPKTHLKSMSGYLN
jgi:hypothetical protein